MYDAIILAGGENSKELSDYTPHCYEALIEIAGRPMVTFVAQALAASGQIGRILVMGPTAELAKCEFPPQAAVLAGGPTIIDTIRLGMAAVGHTRKVVVATSDVPLLTAEAVNDFLAQCSRIEADLYYPIVPKEINERRFPGNRRTYVRLREGVYTGGNLFLVNPAIVEQCARVAEKFIAERKNPLIMCKMLGWSFVIKFLLGMLRLREVEKRVSELLGVRGAVVQSPYPELGIDVDKPSDLELVRMIFSLRT